ncbi:LacI family DNA-binding transcriptional regulator [Microbacterium sp. Se63.02b]|uniref:LacI family DNA-binding transcriptional regulator n=1 Tax=Microbacterium sp. Se63.02b TaxID=2709304 RepID=UPI001605291B|nr:LacI family DNA-binding transcriptional regulator [Microbacterium sp. Se63.02b]QNA91826.1 LacI family transcriptional regulator [Microbacterium sp. Se63.02b]
MTTLSRESHDEWQSSRDDRGFNDDNDVEVAMTHEHDEPATHGGARRDDRRRARITDVAHLAGVSIKTVSRVVNGEAGVLPDTRKRVAAAVLELGFVPDRRARSLKRGDTDTIGILIDAISDPFFAAFVSAVEELAVAAGLNVLFASTVHDAAQEREQLARLTGDRLRGLIISPFAIEAAELEPLRRRFPVICVDRSREGIDSVIVDDYGATYEAISGFLARGHRRIGFIGEETPYPTVHERLRAFRAAHAEAGIEVDETLVISQGRHREERSISDLLTRPDAPTAVFCATSPAAIATIHVLSADHIPMPALISFGDFQFADVFTPGITCVDQDPRLIGEAAFRRLMELGADSEAEPAHIVVPTRLIARGSGEMAPDREVPSRPIGDLR